MSKADILAGIGISVIVATVAIVERKRILNAIEAFAQSGQPAQSSNPGSSSSTQTPGTTPGSTGPTQGTGGPLSAAISADKTQGTAPMTVNFQSQVQGGVGTIQYRWAFGDGGVSFDPNPTYVFTAPGVYDVALSVVDSQGQQFTSYVSISTNNSAPPPPPSSTNPITAVTSSALSGAAPLTVGFSVSVLDPTSSVSWDFGDPNPTTSNPNTDTDLIVNHLYGRAGTYTVTLKVVSAKWGDQTKTFTVTVTSVASPINLYVSESQGVAPFSVAFSVALSVQQSSIMWDFGDGQKDTSNALAVNHTYQNSGTFNGSVTVTDLYGNVSKKPFTITVNINPLTQVTASIIAEPSQIGPNGEWYAGNVTMSGEAGGGTPPFTYSWDFGDGQTGTGLQATHAYAPGTYTIILTVKDSIGDMITASKAISIVAAPAQIGDVSIIIVSNQIIDQGGLQFNSLQLQVQNKRTDISISGFIDVRIFDSSGSEVGTAEQSNQVTIQPGSKTVIPPILSPGYTPGGNELIIDFYDFSVTAKALAEIIQSV